MRFYLTIFATALAAGAARNAPQDGRGDSLEGLLPRAGAYVAQYERDLTAVVAEEAYTQRFIVEPRTEARRLRSDLLTVRDDVNGWVGFRDVFEIDGRPVRDRTDRLAQLFLNPRSDSRSQALRIAEESARFNLAPQVPRTINTPLLALQFIRAQNQGRSKFTDAGRKNVRGSEIRIVAFQELAAPRVIRTPDNAPARGRIWIEAATGRVTETELLVDTRNQSRSVVARIHVVYAEEPRLGLWLPFSMDETYQGYGIIAGQATYSNFRKFSVATDAVIKAP